MKKHFIFIFGLVFSVLPVVQAQTDMQSVAIVKLTKSEPITVKQLKTEVQKVEQQTGRPISVSDRKAILDMMVNERLVLQAADRDKITISDAEVNQQIQQIRASLAQTLGRAPTDAEFSKAIRDETGMDLPAFREQGRKQLLLQKYLLDKKRNLFETIKPPATAEIQKAYDLNKTSFTQDDTIQFSALVFPYNTETERKKARENADKIFREINNSANAFDEKAQKGQSSDAGYRVLTGEYLPKNQDSATQVGQAFLDAAFSLDQGKTSGVLEVSSGPAKSFWIIKVTGRYSAKFLSLDDMVLGRNTTVRNIISEGLMIQQQQKILQQAQQELVSDLRKGNPFTINEQYLDYK